MICTNEIESRIENDKSRTTNRERETRGMIIFYFKTEANKIIFLVLTANQNHNTDFIKMAFEIFNTISNTFVGVIFMFNISLTVEAPHSANKYNRCVNLTLKKLLKYYF